MGNLILLVKGMLCGFAIAAPVGPVGILCAKRTLQSGKLAGMVSGIGAATADTIFGAVAAFGLHFVADLFLENQFWLRMVGGMVLLAIGGWELVNPPHERRRRTVTPNGLVGLYVSTFALTITNPITILSFGAVFVAADAVVPSGDLAGAWTLIVGVFLGSTLWFMSLSAFTSMFHHRIDAQGLRILSRISGWIMIVIGLLVLASLTDLARHTFGY